MGRQRGRKGGRREGGSRNRPRTPTHPRSPKPNHYVDWLLSGECRFGDICRRGFENAVCTYADEYAQVSYRSVWGVGGG